jgi:hypothetical protein
MAYLSVFLLGCTIGADLILWADGVDFLRLATLGEQKALRTS